jgi:hypothetical protein
VRKITLTQLFCPICRENASVAAGVSRAAARHDGEASAIYSNLTGYFSALISMLWERPSKMGGLK